MQATDAAPGRPGPSLPVALLVLLVLWLATRPYLGAVADAQLYLVQAIAWADPRAFATDLFFAHGSQDRFTVFSALYGPLVGLLGPGPAHALALASGQALWLGAAWLLASALLPGMSARLVALAALILLPAGYSHLGLLRYGESIATPRLFAEAATLAALALGLRGQRLLPALLLMGGAVLHPLTAAPGLLVLVLLFALERPRRAVALVAAGALGAMLLPLLPHGSGPLLRMDNAWRDVLASIAPLALPAEWPLAAHAKLAMHLALALLLLLELRGAARRLVLAALLAACLGLLLSVVGGEIARLHLVLAGQPWRALWPLVCVTNLLLPLALRDTLRGGPPEARATGWLLLGTLALTPAVPGMLLASPAFAFLALGQAVLRRAGAASLPSPVSYAALALASGWAVAVLLLGLAAVREGTLGAPWLAPRMVLLSGAGLLLLAAALRRAAPRATTAGTALLLASAVATQDQRTPWQRFVEAPGEALPALTAFLPPGTVFWDGGIDLVWQVLRRPAYFACVQGSGVLFFRGTAIAFRDRAESFPFQQREGECNSALVPAAAPPDRAALARACRAEPGLDFIVVGEHAADAVPAASLRLPVGRDPPNIIGKPFPAGEVYRYDCAALR